MCAHFSTSTQCQIPYCYTYRLLSAGATQGELPEGQEKVPWGITVSRNSLACCNARHLRIRRLILFIFAGAVYHNALTNCAALVSPGGPSLAPAGQFRLSKNPWRAREGQSPLEFQSCPAACTVGTGGFLRRKIPFSRAKIGSLQFLRPEI